MLFNSFIIMHKSGSSAISLTIFTLLFSVSTVVLADEPLASQQVTTSAANQAKQKTPEKFKPAPLLFEENPDTAVTFQQVTDEQIKREERWSDFLPIWGKQAREQGYVLPLPFGITYNYTLAEEPVIVDAIAGRKNLAQFLDLENSEIENQSLRFDAWIFPFYNIYLIAGETSGSADALVNVPQICGPLGLTCVGGTAFPVTISLDGISYGGGMTVAGGIGDFFGVVDVNRVWSERDVLAEKAVTEVYSWRMGWNGKVSKYNGAVWLGMMRLNMKQTAKFDLSAVGISNASIAVDIDSDAHWSGIAGVRWDISREWNAMFEFTQHSQREFALLSLGYRF